MRIVVVGAGPAGSAFALFVKRHCPRVHVSVLERRPPDTTYGWGITLPQWTLSRLETADPELVSLLLERSVKWSEASVFHQGTRVALAGAPLIGVERAVLLQILHERCHAVGVELRFNVQVEPDKLPECDFLVLADGARSAIRARYRSVFGTSVQESTNRFVWLGTPAQLPGLTIAFVRTSTGVMIGHGYPYSPSMSTFVVECSPQVLDDFQSEKPSGDVGEQLAERFADVLQGQPLLARSTARWSSYLSVRNERWSHEHMVVLGDAAHAIHWSVGSGTMLALEDAWALATAICDHAAPQSAYAEFEERRRPSVDGMRRLEVEMRRRLEHIDGDIEQPPLSLAYYLLRPL